MVSNNVAVGLNYTSDYLHKFFLVWTNAAFFFVIFFFFNILAILLCDFVVHFKIKLPLFMQIWV